MNTSIGLVIPAYKPDIDQLSKYIYSIYNEFDNIEIRVELDSENNSIDDRLKTLPVRVNHVSHRRGKGSAITDGFEQLETDVLAFADADGATPASEVNSVIQTVQTDVADLAVGSRRHPDATVHTHQTRSRRYMGDVFAQFARFILDVNLYDYQCGVKAISATAWNQIRSYLHEPGFAWDIELIAMAGAHNLRIIEIPIEWYDRPGSTVDPLATSLNLIRAVLLTWYQSHRLTGSRFYTTISRVFGEPTALVDKK